MHGSTFGGNPVSAAAGNYVMDTVNNETFLGDVLTKGDLIRRRIRDFGCPVVKDVRGKGLMIGVQVSCDPHKVAETAIEAGLIVLTAGKDVIRLLPPLTITETEIDTGLKIFKRVLSQFS